MVKLNKFFSYKHVEIQQAPLPGTSYGRRIGRNYRRLAKNSYKKISMKKCTQKYLRFSCTKLSTFRRHEN